MVNTYIFTSLLFWGLIKMEPCNLSIRLALTIEERHRKPLYTCRFCDNIPAYSNYFATAADNQVSVYKLSENSASLRVSAELVQAFQDSDTTEKYYCCAWASLGTNAPLLVVAGLNGPIKGLSLTAPYELTSLLMGHGDAVYDLRTHPIDDGLMLSASKDESVRLWNLRTCVCIAVFAGSGGHRNAVLAIDIHPLGNTFLSSGMDTTIKIWNLEKPDICQAIQLSDSHPRPHDFSGELNFRTATQQTPLFSTNQVHSNYVDSVKWVGDCVMSKSVCDSIVLWAPDSPRSANSSVILRRFKLPNFAIWYSQMDIFPPYDWFAVGNDDGKVRVGGIYTSGQLLHFFFP